MELNFYHNAIRSKLLTDLQKRGFSYIFKVTDEYICCDDYTITFEEFDIVEVHRMETSSDVDNYILYAINCNKHNIKGVIISWFGIYANGFSNTCITKILNDEKVTFGYHKLDCVKEPGTILTDLVLTQYLS